MKLHALLHQKLVLPSNHIYHENTERLIRANPEIVELGLLEFAFDPRYETFSAYFNDQGRAEKAGRPLDTYGRFLDELPIAKTEYSAAVPARILTDIAIDQLTKADTALARAARISDHQRQEITARLSQHTQCATGFLHFPDLVQLLKNNFRSDQQGPLMNFANLARLMAGAASKNCANMIPQENLLEWCIANPDRNEGATLSDEVIFWEVFLEEIFSATGGLNGLQDLHRFSPKLLSRLSYRDIAELRQEQGFQDFTNAFSSLIDGAAKLKNVGSNQSGIATFSELIEVRATLSHGFKSEIQREVGIFAGLQMIETLMRIPMQLYGGALQAIESLISFMALTQTNDNDWKNLVSRKLQKANRAQAFAARKFTGEPVLLDFMGQITEKAKANWHL